MYPEIFGLIDSYTVMLILGITASLLVLFFFLRKNKYERNEIIDILLCSIVGIASGLIFAILFQNIYDLINYGSNYKWTWAMTFYGGVFGGAGGFVLMYNLFYKRHHESAIKDILVVAPGLISLAHAFGRIGCFSDGCCYGKPTTSWIGTIFPVLEDGIKRVPTQIIEAVFLFVLSSVLLVLAFKNLFNQTFSIYMGAYAIFRFVIEFYRGDYRGKIILGMSPSQIWCILLLLAVPVYWILTDKYIFRRKQHE